MTKAERLQLREEARRMFYHAYDAYMDKAYPADELMPLSCKGRWRGVTPSRGDMDDVLGNFSLTLVDSMDTLAVMGDFSEFSRAIKLILKDIDFDQDIVVSVFETNIRVVGGLLSAHVLATALKGEVPALAWYGGELLALAEDLATRLLPAFNTSTGIPHGRVNLRRGLAGLAESRETCTACAGTMILEMAALSRLTGNPVFEDKAHRAMDRLWKIRHRTSDLMGTVVNVHTGDWVRKESGVGAGIDSYYEYCLKAYILLGDEKYLARFSRHYNAVMKYISRPPVMLAVHMHRPHLQSRNYMDSLLAFWPGLQVLLGDLKPAVEIHEMLYQVMQRHTFIPEAFTTDFQVHWGQHPLRPEFVESTYFLHRATGDEHYLRVGEAALRSLQRHARVPCGYAALGDVRTGAREDRMDSFVLAETFKYLYMLFADDARLPVRLEAYVLTTEAHFLPLALAARPAPHAPHAPAAPRIAPPPEHDAPNAYRKTCPSPRSLVAAAVRRPLRRLLGAAGRPPARLRPFTEPQQLHALADMGISAITLPDGRVQLLYAVTTAKSAKDAAEGLTFMHEMSKWNALGDTENGVVPAGVQVDGRVLPAGPAHFGKEVRAEERLRGAAALARPLDACGPPLNAHELAGKFAVAERGRCTFAQKVRHLQQAGARLAIVLDNVPGSSHWATALFAMSGDGVDDIRIPAVFLFSEESAHLLEQLRKDPEQQLTVGELKAMRQQADGACEGGSCETVLGAEGPPADKETFDHLKNVLKQLVAQFEVSLPEGGSCPGAEGGGKQVHVATTKFVNEPAPGGRGAPQAEGGGPGAGERDPPRDDGAAGGGDL
ncbi:unnamed protein product, partial [Iphiclides podalirius]